MSSLSNVVKAGLLYQYLIWAYIYAEKFHQVAPITDLNLIPFCA